MLQQARNTHPSRNVRIGHLVDESDGSLPGWAGYQLSYLHQWPYLGG